MNILIVPDSHASPDISNDRFTWLGRLILDRQPDIIVNLGDLFDMNSLCSYDRKKKDFPKRRYKDDVAVGVDALYKTHQAFNEFNEQRRSTKRAKLPEPRKIFLHGNHEYRILRAIDEAIGTEFSGLISIDDLGLKHFGYEEYPFKQIVPIAGIAWSHYFPSGVKGLPISGFNIASSLITNNLVSSICGHSHLYDMAIRANPYGTKTMALNAGWYGEEPTFQDATIQFWWSGLTWLHDVHDGVFDVEMITYERVRQLYS